jgi:hypothetical protein
MSAFAARKALATSSPGDSKSQYDQVHLKNVQAETNPVSFELPDSGTQARYGLPSLQVMSEESVTDRTFMDLDETTQLSSYAPILVSSISMQILTESKK